MCRPGPHARNPFADRALAVAASFLALVLTAQGCATGGGYTRVGGSKLSEAAREAKPADAPQTKPENPKEPVPEGRKQRRLEAGEKLEEPVGVEDESAEASNVLPPGSVGPASPGVATVPPSIHRGVLVSLAGGGGFVGGDHYGGLGTGGVMIGIFPESRVRLDAGFYLTRANFTAASGLRESFEKTHELTFELSCRYYLTPEHTLVGIYPIGGLQYTTLYWDYATPIVVEKDGDKKNVRHDNLQLGAPFVGLGTSLIQTRHLHLGGRVIGGVRLHADHTHQGFDNDIFEPTGFVHFLIETTALF